MTAQRIEQRTILLAGEEGRHIDKSKEACEIVIDVS